MPCFRNYQKQKTSHRQSQGTGLPAGWRMLQDGRVVPDLTGQGQEAGRRPGEAVPEGARPAELAQATEMGVNPAVMQALAGQPEMPVNLAETAGAPPPAQVPGGFQ